ncbi:P-loop containing nucleoside triphosphate hydrolase protein [Syncephalis fuscata]|nr:P-loop containing nucleoside triphosphate hydrolase protein [Syncephalis fuscata]
MNTTLVNSDAVHRIALFIEKQINERVHSTEASTNIIVGLNGPQGIGKTTITRAVAAQLATAGHEVHILSIDDLYLTHTDQHELATTTANPLLAHRGLPGTHDIDLGKSILSAFRTGEQDIHVPVYDKSLYNGEGDRSFESIIWSKASLATATTAAAAPRILLFEGWCLGFSPIDQSTLELQLASPTKSILHQYSLAHLETINANLACYVDAWYPFIDLFVILEAEKLSSVYEWREQQEEALRQKNNGSGMSAAAIRSFVDVFMVGYLLWLSQLLQAGIRSTDTQRNTPTLTLTFNHQREIIRTKQSK